MKKVFFVRRNDEKFKGTIVEIPEHSLSATLHQHPKWVVEYSSDEIEDKIRRTKERITESPKQPAFQCPLCGARSISEHGLKVHKARKHG